MRKGLNASIAAALTGIFLSVPLLACSSDEWKLDNINGIVNIHTDTQTEYLHSSAYGSISADGRSELSRPQPLRLSWSYGDCTDYAVELSLDENFDSSIVYHTNKPYIDVYNLYIETAYSWRVTANLKDGTTSVSEPSYFVTDGDAPRNIYVDGVTNMRDLGGWIVDGGKRVRQGMIYRCGRLNKSMQSDIEIEITDRGISTMKGELGIKAEIDLRMPDAHDVETGGITSSPLGDDVLYYNVPMEWDTLLENKPALQQMFALLGDRNNYPLIFHCDIGTDRTGLFAFLINGLMGVAKEDLYRDYMFSNFAKIGNKRELSRITESYVKTIENYNGNTLAEKIRNCLIDRGVAAIDIDALCEIMSEQVE